MSVLPVRWRPPGAVELPIARRRRARAERRTLALGVVSLALTGVAVAAEYGRVWRRGDATDPLAAANETVEVARAAYREATAREAALVNMLGAFTIAFGVVRLSTHTIRARGSFGPFRDLSVGSAHVHHFVPGIALAFMAGGASVLSADESLDPWLALPFGVGVALTLDESALLLKLDDVYWTEEGIVSVQIVFAALAMLSAGGLARRALRRGEAEVLDDNGYAATGAATDISPAGVQTT